MSRQAILVLGAVFAAVCLVWAVLIVPAQHRASSGAAEIAQLREELVAASRSPVEVRVTAGASVSPGVREALRRAMPRQPASGEVIETLAHAAREVGVEMSSISFGAPAEMAGQSGAKTVPVRLSLRGGYRQIVAFVDRLSALVVRRGNGIRASGRLITVDGVQVDAGTTAHRNGESLSSQLQAVAYTMSSKRSTP